MLWNDVVLRLRPRIAEESLLKFCGDYFSRSSDFRVGRREIEPTEMKEDRPLEAVYVAVPSRSVLDELDLTV
jgi:hypothetical protein